MTDIKSNMEYGIPWLLLLQTFYEGKLLHLDNKKWAELLQALEQEPILEYNGIREGYKLLKQADEKEIKELQYSFNYLFVGPDKLKAPPYESCYGNEERTLMQNTSMAVRKAYEAEGLVIDKKNIEPDDFMVYELEFLLYLMSKEEADADSKVRSFLDSHLFKWYAPHAAEIREYSNNRICTGMADILVGVMEYLKKAMNDLDK